LSGLAATSLLLHCSGPDFSNHVTAAVSTDMSHLRSDPLTVLVGSALFADQPWASVLVLFSLSLAPLEQRIGPARTAAVFAAGHVVATLATELPLGAAIGLGWLPDSASHRLDFGVSYGMYACAGALVALLPPPWRRRALAAAAASTVLAALLNCHDLVGCTGHPVALAVGVICGRYLSIGPNERSTAVPNCSAASECDA